MPDFDANAALDELLAAPPAAPAPAPPAPSPVPTPAPPRFDAIAALDRLLAEPNAALDLRLATDERLGTTVRSEFADPDARIAAATELRRRAAEHHPAAPPAPASAFSARLPQQSAPPRRPGERTLSDLVLGRPAAPEVNPTLGEQWQSGVESFDQGVTGGRLAAAHRNLRLFDRIDQGYVPAIPEEDPEMYYQRGPRQRAALRRQVEEDSGRDLASHIQSRARQGVLPRVPEVAEVQQAINNGDYAGAWRIFSSRPWGITRQVAVESAPSAVVPTVTGLAMAPLGAGPAAIGALVTGYAADYGPRISGLIFQDLESRGVDTTDVTAVRQALADDPSIVDHAAQRAGLGSLGPTALNALTMGLTRGLIPGGGALSNARRIVGNIGTEMAGQAGGIAAGQVLSGEPINLGEIATGTFGAFTQSAPHTAGRTMIEAPHLRAPRQAPAHGAFDARAEPDQPMREPPPSSERPASAPVETPTANETPLAEPASMPRPAGASSPSLQEQQRPAEPPHVIEPPPPPGGSRTPGTWEPRPHERIAGDLQRALRAGEEQQASEPPPMVEGSTGGADMRSGLEGIARGEEALAAPAQERRPVVRRVGDVDVSFPDQNHADLFALGERLAARTPRPEEIAARRAEADRLADAWRGRLTADEDAPARNARDIMRAAREIHENVTALAGEAARRGVRAVDAGSFVDEPHAAASDARADPTRTRGAASFQSGHDEPPPVAARLRGDELGPAATFQQLRARAYDWYQRRLVHTGRTVVNAATGITIALNPSGGKRPTAVGERLMRLVPAIPEMLERGVPDGPPRPGDGLGIKAVHVFRSAVEIDGRHADVVLHVGETRNGTFHYSLNWGQSAGGRLVSSRPQGKEPRFQNSMPPAGSAPSNFNIIPLAQFRNQGVSKARVRIADNATVEPALTPEARTHAARISAAFEGAVARKAPAGTKVTYVERIFDEHGNLKAGAYVDATNTIYVALRATDAHGNFRSAREIAGTIGHETVEALIARGVFRQNELAAFQTNAAAWIKHYRIDERYPGATAAQKMNEAVAERMGGWLGGDRAGITGPLLTAFRRAAEILRALATWARGNGFITPESIHRLIERGEMAHRPPGEAGERSGEARFQTPRAPPTGPPRARGRPADDNVNPRTAPKGAVSVSGDRAGRPSARASETVREARSGAAGGEEARAQSAHPDVPIAARLHGEELGPAATPERLRARAHGWFERELVDRRRVVVNAETGMRIGFDPAGARKLLRGGDRELRLVPAIPALLEHGRHVAREPGDRAGTRAVHVFSASAEVAGTRTDVVLRVREQENGTFRYSLTAPAGETTGQASRSSSGTAPPSHSLNITPAREAASVDRSLSTTGESGTLPAAAESARRERTRAQGQPPPTENIAPARSRAAPQGAVSVSGTPRLRAPRTGLPSEGGERIAENRSVGIGTEAVVPGRSETISMLEPNGDFIRGATEAKKARRPDRLDREQGIIGEIKNRAKMHLSRQLKDYLAYADRYGLKLVLYAPRRMRCSGPLRDLIDIGRIRLVHLEDLHSIRGPPRC